MEYEHECPDCGIQLPRYGLCRRCVESLYTSEIDDLDDGYDDYLYEKEMAENDLAMLEAGCDFDWLDDDEYESDCHR